MLTKLASYPILPYTIIYDKFECNSYEAGLSKKQKSFAIFMHLEYKQKVFDIYVTAGIEICISGF